MGYALGATRTAAGGDAAHAAGAAAVVGGGLCAKARQARLILEELMDRCARHLQPEGRDQVGIRETGSSRGALVSYD